MNWTAVDVLVFAIIMLCSGVIGAVVLLGVLLWRSHALRYRHTLTPAPKAPQRDPEETHWYWRFWGMS